MAVFCVANIYIRPLTADDWEILVHIRLESLTKNPNYFAATLEQTKKLTEKEWKDRLNQSSSQVLGLFDNGHLIGITGIYTPDETPHQAVLVMSYIKEEYRGRGHSSLFYKNRIQWALSHPHINSIKVSHRDGNTPSKAAIIKHGFQFRETKEIGWPDGTRDLEYIYELNLEHLRT